MDKKEDNLLSELIKSRKKKEQKRTKEISNEEKELNLVHWTTFYRRNINIYIHRRLGLNLYPFQHVMIYLMSVSKVFFAICSRGLAKTMDVAIYAISVCCLKPYSKVVITAGSIEQARRMVKDKMEDEIFAGKLSPNFAFLPYLYNSGQIKIIDNDKEIKVNFLFNESWIKILPANENSRGSRATVLIFEECRLLKKGIIDSVFSKMSQPRQATFTSLEEYSGVERWQEEAQTIYITSARFKSEWFWNTFKEVVTQSYNNKKIKYNFFAGDIFLSIMCGLKTKSDYFIAKNHTNELDFRMEDLNEMLGEAENAFFSREKFKENQVIKKAFMPPKISDIVSGRDLKNRKKQDNETRFLFIDYAFANTTGGEENDNTIIGCMYGIHENGKVKRGIEYMTGHDASDSFGCERRIRELFWDYKCDYIVLDLRNGGEVNYNNLTQTWDHPERPRDKWNNHGFTICLEERMHVISSEKQKDLRERTIDKQAIPCIIPIVGTSTLNSIMWLDMQKRLNNNEIEFLLEDLEFENEFELTKEYFSTTIEEKAEIRSSYIQTMLLINEAVNLTQEWRNGEVKLEKPRSGHKDRIVSCSYCNYAATLLENKLEKSANSNEDFDIESWGFLAGFN